MDSLLLLFAGQSLFLLLLFIVLLSVFFRNGKHKKISLIHKIKAKEDIRKIKEHINGTSEN